MENFRSLYTEYCKTYNAEQQEVVKSELKRLSLASPTDETSRTFNLSSHHLSDKTCMILSKLLAHDQKFNCLMLNDCSLSNDGIRDFCHAMSTNTSITVLELKGNNIHGEGTENLGKMLRQNSSIKSLSLEWNSIGLMDTHALSLFCESLGMNKTLRDLDLRNNQITHTSAAEVCRAVEVNTGLENLDLRWNSIGLVGGKLLLTALKKNHTLTQLLIAGNNIPEEIADSINLKMGHNTKQSKTAKEYHSRTASLTNELHSIQFQKDKQVNLLLSKIDLQEEAVRKTNRTMSDKMRRLQTALEDRMSTMTSLTSKLSIAEADLALAEQKSSDLEHALNKLQNDRDTETRLFNSRMKREADTFSSDKLRLERELGEAGQRENAMAERVKELERKCQELQAVAYEAKERLAQGQAEYQVKMVVLDDEARKLKQRHREEVKEVEANGAREVGRAKEAAEMEMKALRERVNKMEADKHLLEDSISRLKATIASDKIMYEQQVHEMRTKSEMEEGGRRRELEERVKAIQASKEGLIGENAEMNARVVDCQQKMASKVLEIETLKRNNDSLRNQLQEKDYESMQAQEKLKTDYEKRVRSMQKEIERSNEIKDTVHDMELKLKKAEAESEINRKNYESETELLRSKLRSLEETVQRFREEDEVRNSRAQAMIKEYFKPSVALSQLK